ncbi:membrane protein [Shouchella clausii]|uniref:DUF3100 domain-containing protein n=1 Tax=Shouchella tritolerans TaxID=2979466 RepID=UPI0007896ADA|nr:DUF3100 domain-containing protein [Shouchella tritolerans]GIN12806.1 membrane protein [Shouchella clausii]
MNKRKPFLTDWRLHLLVLGIVVIAEMIGVIEIRLGAGMIMLLPMLFALVFGLALYFTPLVKETQSKHAEPIITLSVALLIAKIGVTIGPDLKNVIAAGPALLLQEIGNFGTLFIALPVAVLLLGMKRESIGMTHSIGREPNLGIIYDKFGFDSPEGKGVTTIYVFGTVFGALFYGLVSGFLATFTPLHPLSLAMASGVGSGSMMAAASGSLIAAYPEYETQIIAFAGASNLLTYGTGLFVSVFIALPLTEKLYALFRRLKGDRP